MTLFAQLTQNERKSSTFAKPASNSSSAKVLNKKNTTPSSSYSRVTPTKGKLSQQNLQQNNSSSYSQRNKIKKEFEQKKNSKPHKMYEKMEKLGKGTNRGEETEELEKRPKKINEIIEIINMNESDEENEEEKREEEEIKKEGVCLKEYSKTKVKFEALLKKFGKGSLTSRTVQKPDSEEPSTSKTNTNRIKLKLTISSKQPEKQKEKEKEKEKEKNDKDQNTQVSSFK